MTLCPVALAVGCRKCPMVSACPLKGVIGDYQEGAGAEAEKPPADDAKGAGK
ncbi:MAG TPA: hypothetical protein VIS77_00710 [Burkholderiales bacterium]